MPSNGEFGFRVLVGGQPIPEYRTDGDVFVETNLYTPASYKEKTEEVVGGQTEVNAWPVTPYTVELTTQPSTPQARYTLTVDGFTVTKVTLSGGQSRIIRGFHDNERGGISEFLFSLPRYAKDKGDLKRKTQVSDVGTIRVRSEDTWKNWLYQPEITTRGRRCRTFAPATKKDSLAVTNGQYTMVTTRMGRNTPAPDRKSRPFRYYRWAVGCWRGMLEVKCRTDDAIKAMGFQIQPYPVCLTANNNVGEVCTASNNRAVAEPDTGSQQNQASGEQSSRETGVGKAEEENMSGMLEEEPSSTPIGRDTTEEAQRPDDSNGGDSHVKPRERSVDETPYSGDVEMADLHNTQVGNDNSEEVGRPDDDSSAGDPRTPLEPSVEETPSSDVQMADLYNENSSKAAEVMKATACDSSREVKFENLVQTMEEDRPERKPNLALLQPETIDLTVDNVPIIDLTIDDYLPEVYEVKVTPRKIEVVDLEEVEHKEQ